MKIKSIAILYIVIALISYGYIYNKQLKRQTNLYPNWPSSNESLAFGYALFNAAGWPLYFSLELSEKMWEE